MKNKIPLYVTILVILTFLFQVEITHYKYFKNDNIDEVLKDYSGDITSRKKQFGRNNI